MARVNYPSIKEIAAEVLREVEAEARIKTAERKLLVEATSFTTPYAQELLKLAEVCRELDTKPRVTINDLEFFMEQCNAR